MAVAIMGSTIFILIIYTDVVNAQISSVSGNPPYQYGIQFWNMSHSRENDILALCLDMMGSGSRLPHLDNRWTYGFRFGYLIVWCRDETDAMMVKIAAIT